MNSDNDRPLSTVPPLPISRDELVHLCAVDSELYAQTFFPKTFRQASPPWAQKFWFPLETPSIRLVNEIAYRGSAKTTRLRVFTSKRIAYGISRTILYIGASEEKAIQSLSWLRNQLDRNTFWRTTFGLERGSKWEETRAEIYHTVFKHHINILTAGVNGSLRGINFDDYRPDLIILDDPQTDETAATQTQREKLSDLILGAVKNSLAPEIDEPNAKLVQCITPQHPEDVSQLAARDSQWYTNIIPCWTEETLELPVDQQVSAWEERFPTETLREDKRAAARRNRISVFAREMECRLISRETSQFRTSWLNIREPGIIPPRGCFAVLAIDPVPPPSEAQMQKGLATKDFEAHYVWSRWNGDYHLCDFQRSRGHDPTWTINTAISLARKWGVARIVIDAVAYQRTLKWLLEQMFQRSGLFYTIVPVADGMKKFTRIVSVLGGLASNGKLWIGPDHTPFLEQFSEYGPTYSGHDDDLDASALALQELANPYLDRADLGNSDSFVEEFPLPLRCP